VVRVCEGEVGELGGGEDVEGAAGEKTESSLLIEVLQVSMWGIFSSLVITTASSSGLG
jgi:hypothetical protein